MFNKFTRAWFNYAFPVKKNSIEKLLLFNDTSSKVRTEQNRVEPGNSIYEIKKDMKYCQKVDFKTHCWAEEPLKEKDLQFWHKILEVNVAEIKGVETL